MSFQLMAWAARQQTGSPTRKAVLMALANAANHHTGRCDPSVEAIRDETELSDSAVRRAMKELADSGLVSRRRRRRPDGSLSVYEFTFPDEAWRPPGGARTPPVGETADPPVGETGHEPGKTFEPGEVLHPSASPTDSEPPRAMAVMTAPAKVDGKRVEPGEATMAWAVLDAWNVATGQSLRSKDWLAKIIMRLREHPELAVSDHAELIRRTLDDPWWRGVPTPSVIYGNGSIFEKSLAAAQSSSLSSFHDHARDAVERARRSHG